MIVVVGAAGFIGTYLTDHLVQGGYEVVAADVSDLGQAHYDRQGIPYRKVDITERGHFDRLPTEGVEAVVHLACVQPANVSEQKYDPADYIKTNVLGTLNVLDFCRTNRIRKIIYTCSHRNTEGLWKAKSGQSISEEDGRSIKYTGDYAMFSISESAATDCVEHYSQTYGMDGIVLRLPPVYGYGPHTEIFRHGKPLKTGFQIFIENATAAKPIEIWGDPENGRDIVYVKDVVAAIELALKKTGIRGLYSVASGKRLTLREQAETIVKVFSPPGKASEIVLRPEEENLIECYVYDIAKARRDLGWSPKYSFEEMLRDYKKEMESKRFAFLLEKRRMLMQDAQV